MKINVKEEFSCRWCDEPSDVGHEQAFSEGICLVCTECYCWMKHLRQSYSKAELGIMMLSQDERLLPPAKRQPKETEDEAQGG